MSMLQRYKMIHSLTTALVSTLQSWTVKAEARGRFRSNRASKLLLLHNA
jgi:hypothetical protein